MHIINIFYQENYQSLLVYTKAHKLLASFLANQSSSCHLIDQWKCLILTDCWWYALLSFALWVNLLTIWPWMNQFLFSQTCMSEKKPERDLSGWVADVNCRQSQIKHIIFNNLFSSFEWNASTTGLLMLTQTCVIILDFKDNEPF